MKAVLLALAASFRGSLRCRAALQREVFALRHQLAVYQRRGTRARIKVAEATEKAKASPRAGIGL